MNWPDVYLFCFAVGVLWTLAALLLSGFHVGHTGSSVSHGHMGHGHVGHGHIGNGLSSMAEMVKADNKRRGFLRI